MNKKINIDIEVRGYEQAKAQITEIIELLERLDKLINKFSSSNLKNLNW